MNKKNITLISAGILLLTLQFNIRFGSVIIDIFSDVLAFILIFAGARVLASRNIMFKKSRNICVLGIVFTAIGQMIHCFDWGDSASQMNSVVLGISTIFTIYFTYYFNEGLMLEAKFQDKSAATRSFRMIWMIFGVLVFVNYIAFMSNIALIMILSQAVTVIFSIYYCSAVMTASKQLYMEGLPTAHMDV